MRQVRLSPPSDPVSCPLIASPSLLHWQVRGILESRGFRVTDEASERKANPGVLSEVSMVYAVRPGYKPPVPSS